MGDKVVIYSDGGAEPNPGYGGWGVVLVHPESGSEREISGGADESTNNRMELTAAIEGLRALRSGCEVELYTDSTYLKRGIQEWLPRWKAKSWRRRDGSAVKNADLWRQLDDLARRHRVEWHWVKGHAGDELNERADRLASREIRARREAAMAQREEPATDVRVLLKLTCNRERGAWIARVAGEGEPEILTGEARGVTANQLELQAAGAILSSLPAAASVAISGGSDYLRRGASGWLAGWKRGGWRTRDGQPVKNADLWRDLDALLAVRRVEFLAPGVEEREEIKGLGRELKRRLGDD